MATNCSLLHLLVGRFLVALAAGPQVFGQGLIAWALAHLPVAFASVSLLIQPVTAGFVAWLLFDEVIGTQQAIGGLIVLAGIMLARRVVAGDEHTAPREVPARPL